MMTHTERHVYCTRIAYRWLAREGVVFQTDRILDEELIRLADGLTAFLESHLDDLGLDVEPR